MSKIAEIMARAIYHGKPRNKPYDLLGQHARQYEKQAQVVLSALEQAGYVVVEESAVRDLVSRAHRWRLNSDAARVSVPLRELRRLSASQVQE